MRLRREPIRWTAEHANDWYARQPWLAGANYVPSNAVNALEMFQPETFDLATNDRELGLAARLGFNVLRVFLHDLLWPQVGFTDRFDAFLSLAAKHGLRVMPVLFDSCWDPLPVAGPQRKPIPGVHNSRWVQSPGATRLADPGFEPLLQAYVAGVVTAYREDPRIVAWDVWNEPDNGWGAYAATEPADKLVHVERLLQKAFTWARDAQPAQPLTSGLWAGDFTQPSAIQQIQLDHSDVITFHNYEPAESFAARIVSLRPAGRPILCTEYMARNHGSTFAAILPVAKAENVAVMNWGVVAGRTQTWYPWDSWLHPYTDREPDVWCHDIFHGDGSSYRDDEAQLLRTLLP